MIGAIFFYAFGHIRDLNYVMQNVITLTLVKTY